MRTIEWRQRRERHETSVFEYKMQDILEMLAGFKYFMKKEILPQIKYE